jgi:hypothetical protein
MLLYGDGRRSDDPREKIARLRAGLFRLRTLPCPRIERHALVGEMLVEAGELEQGLLDHRFALDGEERPGPLGRSAARLTGSIAEALLLSFLTQGSPPPDEEGRSAVSIERSLTEILALDLPERIEISVPEGYAFYGLYPETYFRAAAAAALGSGEEGPFKVLGIRSIGTGLAAAVATVLTLARRPAEVASVRPIGHPFCREIALGRRLERDLLANVDGARPPYAVVDEGPGLSGSSFGSVADWLEDRGVPPQAITFFPSHRGGLGPYADERHRRRWNRARRFVTEFESVFASPEARWPLAGWAEDWTGEATEPLLDLSAGRWRERVCPDRSRWPAVDLQGERRKYLLTSESGRWLLKFAGLGRYGREKLALAEALGDARLIPPILGLRHGFLVGPWLEDARPLPLVPAGEMAPRALLDAVSTYLAFRAARFPAPPEAAGATPQRLFEMAVHNTGKALGPDFAGAVETWRGRLPEIARLARPMLTDNRMQAWEWLVISGGWGRREGRILKADALDHHRGNDLVGPQDVAWDIAGAAVELDLGEDGLERLADAVERRIGTARIERLPLAFYLQAYLAFQIGRHTLAAEAVEAAAPAESAALRAETARYAEHLRRAIARTAVEA